MKEIEKIIYITLVGEGGWKGGGREKCRNHNPLPVTRVTRGKRIRVLKKEVGK
jgi:hypothetical protein